VTFSSPDLFAALSGTPLGHRLDRCGERRGFVDNTYWFPCNQPACPRCRKRYLNWRIRHLVGKFGERTESPLITFSVRLAPVADGHSVLAAFVQTRQAIRNAARKPRWRGARASGHFGFDVDGSGWWPRLRGLAQLPRLAYQDFRRDLEAVFPIVRVQPLDGELGEILNAELPDQLASPDCSIGDGVTFYTALYRIGGGFRTLSCNRGLRSPPSFRNRLCPAGVEPMPMLFDTHVSHLHPYQGVQWT
jgi:hypothetical protein